MTIGENLRRLLDRSGLSQDRFAQECGYKGASSVQRFLEPDYNTIPGHLVIKKLVKGLLGKGIPPIGTAEIAAALGIPEALVEVAAVELTGQNATDSHTSGSGEQDMQRLYELAVRLLRNLPPEQFYKAVEEAARPCGPASAKIANPPKPARTS